MTNQIERRVIHQGTVRASSTSKGNVLAGLAIRYGASANIGGKFIERIAPGAAHRVMTDPKFDCRFLVNHNSDLVLGRTASGTLQLTETKEGVAYSCDLPDTQAARDLYTSVKRGDVTGCSFGFTVGPDDDEWGQTQFEGGSMVLRTINNFKSLMDVSPVAYPAYEGTTIEARHSRQPMSHSLRHQCQRVLTMQRSGEKRCLWASPMARFIHDVDHSAEVRARRRNLLNIICSQ